MMTERLKAKGGRLKTSPLMIVLLQIALSA